MLAVAAAPEVSPVPVCQPTLDELISSAWEGLAARGVVPCPCCGGDMVCAGAVTGRSMRGRCGECGCELS